MPTFVKGKHFAAPTSKSSSTYDGVTRTGRASKPGRDVGAVWTDGPLHSLSWISDSKTDPRSRATRESSCLGLLPTTHCYGCLWSCGRETHGRRRHGVTRASRFGQNLDIPRGVLKEFHCKSDAEARAGGH